VCEGESRAIYGDESKYSLATGFRFLFFFFNFFSIFFRCFLNRGLIFVFYLKIFEGKTSHTEITFSRPNLKHMIIYLV
jgi:hypothetical protein